MEWETVIGLEVHVQLATRSKIFSGASTAFGAEPNTQACGVDLAMPGTLPVLNAEAVRMAAMFGLAINAQVSRYSVFDRKNYFYPDLPKGYQISQLDHPVVLGGEVLIQTGDSTKKINVTRAHLEEDAGKSLHEDFHGMTGIDLNRAGTPLLEIVSEPEIRSAAEAVAYLKKLHAIVTCLGISDGNMAEGSMRCDCNISVRPAGTEELGTRTEIKNVNSFRFVEKAVNYEVARQIDLIESGGKVTQETRLYDAGKNETRPMRSKEFANDYRYFPDPDLLPVEIDEAFLTELAESLPELPDARQHRFRETFGLSAYDAAILGNTRPLADYFEAVVRRGGDPKLSANWVSGELSRLLNQSGLDITQSPVAPEALAALLARIEDKTISGKIAKQVLDQLWQGADSVDEIITSQGLRQVTDDGAIARLVEDAIQNNPKQVEQYRNSPPEKQKKLLGFFVGQVMKASRGKANPAQVNQLLGTRLSGD